MQEGCQGQLGLTYVCVCLNTAHRLDHTKNGHRKKNVGLPEGREGWEEKSEQEVTAETKHLGISPKGVWGPQVGQHGWASQAGSCTWTVSPQVLRLPEKHSLQRRSQHFHPLLFLTVWSLVNTTSTTIQNGVCFLLFLLLNTLCWVLSFDTLVALQVIPTSLQIYESASQVLTVTWKWSFRGSQRTGNRLNGVLPPPSLRLLTICQAWRSPWTQDPGLVPWDGLWWGSLSTCESLSSQFWTAGTIRRRANSHRRVLWRDGGVESRQRDQTGWST